MAYEHVEPPVAVVTMDAYLYPKSLAKQMIIAGNTSNGYTEVMHLLSALSLFREAAYGYHSEYPGQSATVESVMNFVHKHPYPWRQPDDHERMNRLCIQLLDHIKFYKELAHDFSTTDAE